MMSKKFGTFGKKNFNLSIWKIIHSEKGEYLNP